MGARSAGFARWAAVGGILGVIVLTLAFAGRFGIDPSLVASPLIGQPAPEVTLPYLQEQGSLTLGELRGEIMVINFWASWCLACRAEHDDLVAAADAYRGAGVRFVGIVYQDRPQDAIAYLDEMGRGQFDYVMDPGSRAAIEFGVFGVPETFFIDREGTIVAKITGESSFPLLAAILDQIILGRRPESRTTGTVQSGPDN
ncbi:MAG: TlpA family protein disulfide reductase [Acidimicrobiia bacterium]